MKKYIEGFNQKGLIMLGLDSADAVLLRYVVDFFKSSKIRKIIVDNKTFMWLSYQKILDDLPILDISRRYVAKKFDKYVSCGLMEKYLDIRKGNYTYFRFTEKYDILVCDDDEWRGNHAEDQEMISEEQTDTVKRAEAYPSEDRPISQKEQTKIVLLNSTSSIENKNNKYYVENEVLEVLDYLNERGNKKFKPVEGSLKFIRARLREGFTVEDMKKVIDSKVEEWQNNWKMKVYIRPQTLFNAEKFDCYLNNLKETEEPAEEYYEKEEREVQTETPFEFDPEKIRNPKLREKYYKYFSNTCRDGSYAV